MHYNQNKKKRSILLLKLNMQSEFYEEKNWYNRS